jgi:transcriptional regulator with XRE-family HTH domain
MFHKRLKKICNGLGIETAPELFRRMLDAGFRGSERTVRYWWEGHTEPSYGHLKMLAGALDVSINKFF